MQVELDHIDLLRVVSLAIATSRATYAFAPALLGALLATTDGAEVRIGQGAAWFISVVAAVQVVAIGVFLAGRGGARCQQRLDLRSA